MVWHPWRHAPGLCGYFDSEVRGSQELRRKATKEPITCHSIVTSKAEQLWTQLIAWRNDGPRDGAVVFFGSRACTVRCQNRLAGAAPVQCCMCAPFFELLKGPDTLDQLPNAGVQLSTEICVAAFGEDTVLVMAKRPLRTTVERGFPVVAHR